MALAFEVADAILDGIERADSWGAARLKTRFQLNGDLVEYVHVLASRIFAKIVQCIRYFDSLGLDRPGRCKVWCSQCGPPRPLRIRCFSLPTYLRRSPLAEGQCPRVRGLVERRMQLTL